MFDSSTICQVATVIIFETVVCFHQNNDDVITGSSNLLNMVFNELQILSSNLSTVRSREVPFYIRFHNIFHHTISR